jgi:DNA (cytosine-5)-methyltransferase 1
LSNTYGLGMRFQGYPRNDLQEIVQAAQFSPYKAIESFCGPGGMSLGLRWAGFDVRVAFDIDPPSVATHQGNLPGHCFAADVRSIDGAQLMELCGVVAGELALFAGGPPCQGFSKQRRGAHLGDERNDLVLDYIRLVEQIKPRFLLFENVAIFGQLRGRHYFREMQNRLSDYRLVPHFYNAADYGLPQTRERFVVVGQRHDQKGHFSIPAPTVSRWRTVGEVIGDLPEPPDDYSVHPKLPNHQKARITAINEERFSYVPQGGGWRDIPEHLRLPCHKGVDPSSGGWPDVYGRLRQDGQCPTITGGFDSFTRGRYGHPIQNRAITPREAARMQGFPDDFLFSGNRGDVRSQIGNVVPPPLAEAIGIEILHALLVSDGRIKSDLRSSPTPSVQTELFQAA